MVNIPIYDDLSLSLVGERGAGSGDVTVTGIQLASLGLELPQGVAVLIPGDYIGAQGELLPTAVLNQVLEFPARTFQLSQIGVAIAWTSLRLRFALNPDQAVSQICLDIHDLRLSTALVPGFEIAGHLTLCFNLNQVLSLDDSAFNRLEAGASDTIPLELEGLRLTEAYFAIRWKETRINYWLRGLAPNFFDQSASMETITTLRVLFGRPIPEIRLDWQASGVEKTFTLPGFKLVTPERAKFTLLLQSLENPQRLDNLAFILTLDPRIPQDPEKLDPKQRFTAYTNFAWERQNGPGQSDRELQPPSDDNSEPTDGQAPFLQLDAMPGAPVSLVLLQIRLDQGGLPGFFRQLDEPLTALSFDRNGTDPLAAKTVTSFRDFIPLRGDDWGGEPATPAPKTPDEIQDLTANHTLEPGLTVTLNPFILPFLNRPADDSKDSSGNSRVPKQRIRVNHNSRKFRGHATFGTREISMPLAIGVLIGELEFDTSINLKFNWETFAFRVEHSGGIRLLSDQEQLPEKQFLGLTWRFKGGKLSGDNRYHHLTLITQNYDYKLIQGTGAVIEVDYTRASDDPITFAISDLAISAKGLSITAAVTDRPARLNGVDTRFRFHGSRLSIVENRIQAFTLAGSGPLPPALVGDAMVDVSLQFAQREGNLTLVEGSARLSKDKLLSCKGTRFAFAVDAIGLKFVNEGKFHLYFTLTGSAQFRLAPGDSPDGPLALLSAIKIEMVDCPLTGDMSVIARHVNFLIDLPKPVSFNLLGCFEMEIRGFGFVPQFDKFDGAGAMRIAGQVKFAQGGGDAISARIDVHDLYVGLPRPGSFIPRLHLRELTVEISAGKAFNLYGVVEFIDEPDATGFAGEGRLEIKGMPVIAASFSFLRVRRDETAPWVRAWFIFLQIEQVTFRIPYVELYLREVGLGFGYRYTIASIRAADEAGDLRSLLQELRQLSRTQGDLTRRDRWAVDLEKAGEPLRWTIVLRALISQTSASPNSLKWIEAAEKVLPCLYVMDAIIAFRSDLTFFMAVRCWLNTNYWGFVTNQQGLRERPLFSGFVLLSVRQKRFIAQISSNPDGSLGHLVPVPPMVERIVNNGQFSATLLIEPGLVHAELGWPNMLRWSTKIGPLEVDIRGGAIFRTSTDNLVIGVSFYARGGFRFEAEKNLRLFGARVSAEVHAAFGARYIGLMDFNDPIGGSAFYAAIGLEVRIRVAIEFWIKFIFVTRRFRLSFSLEFTAAAEIGLAGVNPNGAGFRAQGTLSVRFMGRGIQLGVRVGFREHNIQIARSRTEPFLNMGLEATDVEAVPGVGGGTPEVASSPQPMAMTASPAVTASPAAMASPVAMAAVPEGSTVEVPPTQQETEDQLQDFLGNRSFTAPNYDVFWIEAPEETEDGSTQDPYGYFVLVPRGEPPVGSQAIEEQGFLPVPPASDEANPMEADFTLELPRDDALALDQYDPLLGDWQSRSGGERFDWRVNWEATVISGTLFDSHTEQPVVENGEPQQGTQALKNYLVFGFIVDENDLPQGDPDLLSDRNHDQSLTDERVHNPTADSFESAVRGAVEQFSGSPFFKRDPNSAYDQALEAAFQPNTTVYNDSGEADAISDLAISNLNQQAHQLRGLVVQDLVSDLRDYAVAPVDQKPSISGMIGFQMGLVFRYQGPPPHWLSHAIPPAQQETALPKIYQRLGPSSTSPDLQEARQVRSFNVASTNFATNPPQFQRVEQFTDANTIAFAWDLVWPDRPDANCSACQAAPEQHLIHYQVLRRSLDGSEQETTYTVKGAEVLHFDTKDKDSDGVLKHLQPRFQVVDHFNAETLADQANLPVTGRSYVYTITPIDLANHRGRPLTLVATRYPNEPPRVPVDAQLRVSYRLRRQEDQTLVIDIPNGQGTEPLLTPISDRPVAPPLLLPQLPADEATQEPGAGQGILVSWTDPAPPLQGPLVPIADYRLIFRRETLLPIGSYGLDNSIQGPRTKTLPTSNARPLPTDIVIPLDARGSQSRRQARIPLGDLQAVGIFPPGEPGERPQWQPLSWRVYIQTESANGVPSALAPVELLLRLDTPDGGEERQLSELEWLPQPIRLPVLPPEDLRASTGKAHVPMPQPAYDHLRQGGNLALAMGYGEHPAHLRLVRFRWNQGPSDQSQYPLELTGGYHILQLDVDAHTDRVLQGEDPEAFARALKPVQEVQMLPAEDLWLTPEDTLNGSVWEAWYSSAMVRRRRPEVKAQQRSELDLGPWYSWRESVLVWPAWPGLSNPGRTQTEGLHPLLTQILRALEADYTLDVQTTPPMQPVDLAGFLNTTAYKADPYGWGILQRLGLSVGLSLRSQTTNDLLTGPTLVTALQTVLAPLQIASGALGDWQDYLPHLYLELLVQPSHSISPEPTDSLELDGLLAMVQISLRPRIQQRQRYGQVHIRGRAGTPVPLQLTLPGPCSVIDQSDRDRGQIELPAAPDEPIQFSVVLPLTGETTLLFRSAALPTVTLNMEGPSEGTEPPEVGAVTSFLPTDERSAYFAVDIETLASQWANSTTLAGQQWQQLRDYLEFLNPDDTPGPNRIHLPVGPSREGDIAALLPDVLAWAQRFFDASGMVTTEVNGLNQTAPGPWLVTAYPQRGTPAYASPDPSGRLRYDHLIESRWAHNYRYYIRPYSRYDLLWQGLLQSPILFPEERPEVAVVMVDIVPDPQVGGLDVVLDRTQPVDAPLIIHSERLDNTSTPGQSAPPGRTWEVMLAQHPEQRLAQRNQTLARQLDFRGVAFTLLRQLADPDWPDQLRAASTGDLDWTLAPVEQVYPALPAAYPAQPDHVDLTQVKAEVARSLDLPHRLSPFQQGAMVLQWQALPYFYHHRFLAVAQTSTLVSRTNETTQQDFEYRSPDPEAWVDALTLNWTPVAPFEGETVSLRTRRVQIPLRRFWDCMPEDAQERWQAEAPLDKDTPGNSGTAGLVRKYASLPDPEVVYQIAERFSGNIEVQAEYVFEPATPEADNGNGSSSPARYTRRQLGQRFLAAVVQLNSPTADRPHGDYWLETTLQQLSEIELRHDSLSDLRSPTASKVAFADHWLSVISVLTRRDRNNLWLALIAGQLSPAKLANQGLTLTDDQVATVLDDWFSSHPITAHSLADLPPALLAKVDYPELPYRPDLVSGLVLPLSFQNQLCLRAALPEATPSDQQLRLIWRGALSGTQDQELRAYDRDLPSFHQAVENLSQQIRQSVVTSAYRVPVRPRPDAPLPGTLTIQLTYPPAADPGWVLGWRNGLSTLEQEALQGLVGDAPFTTAVTQLIEQINATYVEFSATTSPLTPISTPAVPEGLPLTIRQRSSVFQLVTYTLIWTGPMTPSQEQQLEQWGEGLSEFFTSTIQTLIEEEVRPQFPADQYPSNRDSEAIEFEQRVDDADFVWPRVDRNQLAAQIQADLSHLEIQASRLRWQGVVPTSTADLRQRVQVVLRPGDPFLEAFQRLMNQLDQAVFTVALGRQYLRLRQSLTATERDVLTERFEPTELTPLFDDWADGQAIDELYQTWFSQDAIATVPAADRVAELDPDLQAVVDFPEPEELVLVRTGVLTAAETDALLNLPGDAEFKAALRQLTRPRQGDLSAVLQDQLRLDPEASTLSWQGDPPSQAQLDALREIPGDEAFHRALGDLVTALAIATAESTESVVIDPIAIAPAPATARAVAPQGLDQIPAALADKVQLSLNQDGSAYTQLTWTGPLTDAAMATLQNWAQTADLVPVVRRLIQERQGLVLSRELPDYSLPTPLQGRLHLYPNKLVWTGDLLTSPQWQALTRLRDTAADDAALAGAIDALLTTPAEQFPVVAIAAPGLDPRPQPQQRPDLFKAPDLAAQFADQLPDFIPPEAASTLLTHQLVIQPDRVSWLGPVHHQEQLDALAQLPGDAAFKTAIADLHTQLSQQESTIPFDTPAPRRPLPTELPENLQAKLLLGRTQIRYHGLITLTERRALRDLVSPSAPDQQAIQRLFEQSLSLQGNQLQIRARRGSAQPSPLRDLSVKEE
ncbi:hypothetical protein [Nodosilinea sp. P-1105]|uniref:hypothetical protein n=1 Tax=Nodosilinea sp. P-1105 TaxID=2546229 RepID=UPI00146A96F7|nr:hypothetical protein [Nodosilinea sp. P-1105]NMF82836.1 hypothetical protein [Nodosilinea sp. P-1105]